MPRKPNPINKFTYTITWVDNETRTFFNIPDLHPEAKDLIIRILEDKDCVLKLTDMEQDGVDAAVVAMLGEIHDRGETWEDVLEFVVEKM